MLAPLLLQHVAMCCSVSQYIAVYVAPTQEAARANTTRLAREQTPVVFVSLALAVCVAVSCSVLQWVAVGVLSP